MPSQKQVSLFHKMAPYCPGTDKIRNWTKLKIEFFTKTVFLVIQVETGEVWGCPGGAHGPYEDIPSNFGRIWSYMASESPLFNIFRKLTSQCTRNGPQNLPFCAGSLQDTFLIYSSIYHQHMFEHILQTKQYRESNI